MLTIGIQQTASPIFESIQVCIVKVAIILSLPWPPLWANSRLEWLTDRLKEWIQTVHGEYYCRYECQNTKPSNCGFFIK